MSQKGPPFEFFSFFATECMSINPKGPPSTFFGTMRLFLKENFFQKSKVFPKKNVLRFLSLRYGADFRRSRLVIMLFGAISVQPVCFKFHFESDVIKDL